MRKPLVSLILPCFNEEEHIRSSVDRIFSVLKKADFFSEVIFVDDKSTDNTRFYLKNISKKYKFLPTKIILHKKNMGRGASVSDGIKESKGKIVGFIDIDCEISPHYIPIFVKTVKEEKDVVTARRIYKFKLFSIHRYIASKMYAVMVRMIFKLKLHDTEAGYKFFNKQKIMPVLTKVRDNYWFWDTEILIRSKLEGLSIKELPTIFKRRNDKTSTVKLIPDILRYIKGIIRLKKELNKNYESF